ncbi:unnamed protein product [Linum tenue]|uniref:Uncharacterized protein n=1 Tax=Linum tenue TaxID=586396 RepID=A0AAV0IMF2_9ROSI|nr:unnamed protein product [Linum tenue]
MWRLKSCRAMLSIKKLLRRRRRGSRFRRLKRGGGVPGDVKKGHFAVEVKNSNGGDEVTMTTTARRVVVPLRCLKNPHFVRLLDQAADEYGFRCQGTVTVCCRPADLETVLAFC